MPPFADDIFPSLALGILKACLLRAGISCRVEYASSRFLRELGYGRARHLLGMDHFAGEAVFAPLAGFTPRKGLDELVASVVADYGDYFLGASARDTIFAARKAAERCVEETTAAVLSCSPQVLGVISSFQQQNAALAIMGRIKKARPDVVTMLGGANCMGRAGGAALRCFSQVDYVFFGEADEIFVEVVKKELSGEKNFPLPYGVLRRGEPFPETWPHRLTKDLDALPCPDFDDFFAVHGEKEKRGSIMDFADFLEGDEMAIISLEGSRGCWWGEKHPCTFCGLNGQHNRYRQKSPRRVVEELREIKTRYGSQPIFFTDSIMSRQAQKELPGLLTTFSDGQRFFTEIKSNLTEDEVKELAAAGFSMLQPGIESLSDHVLRLMNKGNTAIRHVALLKYARTYGVRIVWNLLHRFPGETTEDYETLAELLPLLTHLDPPNGLNRMVYHKYSVYVEHPDRYGLDLAPSPWYDFCCPDDEAYIRDSAYLFVDRGERVDTARNEAYRKVHAIVEEWKSLAKKRSFADRLEMVDQGDRLEILDLRKCRVKSCHTLQGLDASIYRLCRAPVTRAKLLEVTGCGEKELEMRLSAMRDNKLIVSIGGEILALAAEGRAPL
ncbi:MAG: RiPP maturation radical SAM C-methyltransferase [Schwartzia sp.]|nr:RiPP maturation radical SAM C-methyltransferase [Schwartzia sp. (in: firmicutes)]